MTTAKARQKKESLLTSGELEYRQEIKISQLSLLQVELQNSSLQGKDPF